MGKRSNILVGATVTFAVTALSQSQVQAEEDKILVGAAVAQSGFMSAFDGPSLTGFKVFVDQFNAAGGLDGKKMELRIVDTRSTPAGAKDAATQLVNDGVEIMLTSANFDFGAPAGNVAQAAGILNFSLGAASPLYGPVGIGTLAYSPAPSTYLEGHVMAQTLVNLGKSRPFLLIDDSIDYGTQVGDGVKQQFEKLGFTLAGEATFKNGDSSIATQISQIISSNADSIALASYQPGGATALRQIRAAGINLPVSSDLGMGGTDWVNAVPNLNDFYVTALASIYGDDPDPAVQAFVANYKKVAGADPATTQVLEGYNVGEMIIAALKETGGNTDGAGLAKVLDGFKTFKILGGSISYNVDKHIKVDGPVTVLKYTNGKPAFSSVVTITD